MVVRAIREKIMALFKRKQQNQEEVPAEIQEYYQAERRERVGVAWLLAFATLVVTVLLAVGLFFGGRWVYRQIFNNNGESGTTQTEQTRENEEESEQASNSSEQSESEQSAPETSPSAENETSTPENSSQTQNNETAQRPTSEQPRSSTPSTPSNQPTTSTPTATNTPRTGPLPSTGPGDVVAVFVLTTMAASALHYAISTAKSKS
jgi:cytoskeletal protein RodZ